MTLPLDYTKLSKEQIEAVAKDKGMAAQCATFNTPWGPVRSVSILIDKGSMPAGSIKISPDCQIDNVMERAK